MGIDQLMMNLIDGKDESVYLKLLETGKCMELHEFFTLCLKNKLNESTFFNAMKKIFISYFIDQLWINHIYYLAQNLS